MRDDIEKDFKNSTAKIIEHHFKTMNELDNSIEINRNLTNANADLRAEIDRLKVRESKWAALADAMRVLILNVQAYQNTDIEMGVTHHGFEDALYAAIKIWGESRDLLSLLKEKV